MHILTQEDQIKTFKNLKKHLSKNGKIITNFFFPRPELMTKKLGRIWKYDVKPKQGKFKAQGKYLLFDEIDQIAEFNQSLSKGTKKIWNGKFRMTYFYKREFELLLRLAGFKRWKIYGGFEYRPLKEKTQEMVWVIEK